MDSSSGSLALASREMRVGFYRIWGAEGTPGPGLRIRTDQPHAAFVRLRRWIGGAPLMLSIWTSCLPLGVDDLCPHAIWLGGGPKPLSPGATKQSWDGAPLDLDPSTQRILTGTISRPLAAPGGVPSCPSPWSPASAPPVLRGNPKRL